jgi:hypothetical protein
VKTLTSREASIFTAFTATVVSPEPPLPAVDRTDATQAFDDWLARAPRLNAIALRAALTALDLAPLAFGFRRRLRNLDDGQRARSIDRIEHSSQAPIRQAAKALKGIAFLCYYGDDGIMLTLGYDASANVRRAKSLRAAEGRP